MNERGRGEALDDARRNDDDEVIELRDGRVPSYGPSYEISPPSAYGYDSVLPDSWRPDAAGPQRRVNGARREAPTTATKPALPRRFRLLRRFPPLQRVVHHGPVDGRDVDVPLTMWHTMRLHSTGIEFPMRALDGRLRDEHHLRLLVDAFGRDRRSLGTSIDFAPNTLGGAKRIWHKQIAARTRHGFAMAGEHLVVLEYLPPERDLRRRDFGIAYKRIVVAYEVDIFDRTT